MEGLCDVCLEVECTCEVDNLRSRVALLQEEVRALRAKHEELARRTRNIEDRFARASDKLSESKATEKVYDEKYKVDKSEDVVADAYKRAIEEMAQAFGKSSKRGS